MEERRRPWAIMRMNPANGDVEGLSRSVPEEWCQDPNLAIRFWDEESAEKFLVQLAGTNMQIRQLDSTPHYMVHRP